MLTRFSPKIGAAVFGALALIYMVAALATGHSARAEAPVNLAPTEAGVDVWQALSLMVDHGSELAVVDVRPSELYELYHLPTARNLPGASADALGRAKGTGGHLLVVAETDAKAAELVGALGKQATGVHFLKGGAADFYLSLELPTALFSSKPAPYGYAATRETVRAWLTRPQSVEAAAVRAAVETLARLAFSPDQLAGKKKAPAAGKKRIAGGCG